MCATVGLFLLSTVGAAIAFPTSVASGPAPTLPSFPTPVRHVVVIFMENANASWVLQNGTYQSYLAQKYSYASQFYSVKHGSNPSYFAATSGNTWTYLQEYSTLDLADLTAAQQLTWGAFEQSMPTPCEAVHTSKTAAYSSGHNPFAWYADVYTPASYCDSHDVGFGPLVSDLASGTMPSYSLIVANQTNDAHTLCPGPSWETRVNCGDAWLHSFLSPILNGSSAWARSTAFLLAYDEANLTDTRGLNGATGGGIVYAAAVGDCATPHYTTNVPYSTFSLLTTTEWLLGLGHTGHHDSWSSYPPMESMFQNPACGTTAGNVSLSTSAAPSYEGTASPASGSYASGSSVTLGETPTAGDGFLGWAGTGLGSYSGPAPTPTVTLGGDVTEVADFGPLYPVTFTETGLSTGTSWSVSLGTSFLASTGTSLDFAVVNGTTPFSVSPVAGYSSSPSSGNVVVAGGPASVPVTFSVGGPSISSFEAVPSSIHLGGTSLLEVAASGGSGALGYGYSNLPSGCATLDTASLSCTPSATGTFMVGVTVTDGLGSTASASTSLTVASGAQLAFSETGLPGGTVWNVTVGTETVSSSSTSLDFYLAAGSYHYVIGPVADHTAKKPSGSVSLSSAGTGVSVTFEHAYLVTFTETGLASGTSWAVELRTVTLSSTTSTITFWTPNGTYAYGITPVPGYLATGSPSSVVVAHAPTGISVTFAVTLGAANAATSTALGNDVRSAVTVPARDLRSGEGATGRTSR